MARILISSTNNLPSIDTLLNVFLAIAVDNLTNAEILTHDEEAAENKRIKHNLQKAFECDHELNQNALSFVSNLQAKAISMQEDEARDNNNDDDDGIVSSSKLRGALQNGHTYNENLNNNNISNNDTNEYSIPGIVLQNGNSLPGTPNLQKNRKNISSVFDKVLLNVKDEKSKPNDLKSCFSPKKRRKNP